MYPYWPIATCNLSLDGSKKKKEVIRMTELAHMTYTDLVGYALARWDPEYDIKWSNWGEALDKAGPLVRELAKRVQELVTIEAVLHRRVEYYHCKGAEAEARIVSLKAKARMEND